MRRLAVFGAAIATAALLIGCVPVDPAPTSTTSAPPTTSQQELKACEIEKRTTRTALEAYRASPPPEGGGGLYPDSLDELVGWWLEELPRFAWVYTSDGATYTMTGPC